MFIVISQLKSVPGLIFTPDMRSNWNGAYRMGIMSNTPSLGAVPEATGGGTVETQHTEHLQATLVNNPQTY